MVTQVIKNLSLFYNFHNILVTRTRIHVTSGILTTWMKGQRVYIVTQWLGREGNAYRHFIPSAHSIFFEFFTSANPIYFIWWKREQGYLNERPVAWSYILTKVYKAIILYLSNASEWFSCSSLTCPRRNFWVYDNLHYIHNYIHFEKWSSKE